MTTSLSMLGFGVLIVLGFGIFAALVGTIVLAAVAWGLLAMRRRALQEGWAPVDLKTPLGMGASMMFPLQSEVARREVLIGALWLLVPGVGWILNMGHRIMMTHRMQRGLSAWPAWVDYRTLFRHGLITFVGMVEYHAPSVLVWFVADQAGSIWLHLVSMGLWLAATVAVPGYMTHYCRTLDPMEIFNPLKAMRRVFEGGLDYWRAWGIALTALVMSFSGLLFLGVGFLVTSVWFWQVAGFSFASVFSQKFHLMETSSAGKERQTETSGV